MLAILVPVTSAGQPLIHDELAAILTVNNWTEQDTSTALANAEADVVPTQLPWSAALVVLFNLGELTGGVAPQIETLLAAVVIAATEYECAELVIGLGKYQGLTEPVARGALDGALPFEITVTFVDIGEALPGPGARDNCVPLLRIRNATDTDNRDGGFRIFPSVLEHRISDSNAAYGRLLGVYHPSAVAQAICDRALAYERIGFVPKTQFTARDIEYFDAGHVIHGVKQSQLKAFYGDDVEIEPTIAIPELFIQGNADVIFRINEFATDIKTVSPDEFVTLKSPRAKDVRQLHIYMMARDIPRGSISYVNRDTWRVKELPVPFAVRHMNWIASRVSRIERALEAGTLPDRVDAGNCGDCRYAYVCRPKAAT